MIKIALDMMGEKDTPKEVFKASLAFLRRHSDAEITLVGPKATFEEYSQIMNHPRLFGIDAEDYVRSDDDPLWALRHRQKSSMAVAIQEVQFGRADVVISSGETGALVAMTSHYLKRLPGFRAPALVARIPTRNGKETLLLDVGAYADNTPDEILCFAKAALDYSKKQGVTHPTVGVLSNGSERRKGNRLSKEAFKLLEEQLSGNFIGNVEPKMLILGTVDICVTDGFTGNISIKFMEAMMEYIAFVIKSSPRLWQILAFPLLSRVKHRLNPDLRNGAPLLGIKKLFLKVHGGSKAAGFLNALETAYQAVKQQKI
jgi:phosphate acyltransferase